MMLGMQYDLEEVFNQSIMTKIPSVLVEGFEDISIYDRVINGIERQACVIAIENIEGFSKGCESVVNAADQLLSMGSDKYSPFDYMICIIDKDVRDFRGDVPSNEIILTLESYSIESHFVNSEVVEHLLKVCTKGTSDLFTEKLKSKLLNDCVASMELLYIASLEALKGAVDSGYSSEFGYCQKYGRLKDVGLEERLRAKKNELFEFASK